MTARERAVSRLAALVAREPSMRVRLPLHEATAQVEIIVDDLIAAVGEALLVGRRVLPRVEDLAPTRPPGVCGVPGRGGTCVKPMGHGQRHRYGTAPVTPPPRDWGPVESARIPGSRYSISVGSPVKVLGEGRKTPKNPEGSADDGWKVIRIERHRETGKINVEVKKERTGHGRTFPIEKIVYKRSKRVA